MAEWYSWQDLLYRWNKLDFELLELIKKGLQPFSEYGNLISFHTVSPESGIKDAADESAPSWSNMELPLSDTEAASAIELLKKAHFRRANVIDIELQTDLWKHTRPTLRWRTGNDLLELWSIDEFDLCKLIFEWGLPAYDSQTLRSIKTGSDHNNSIGDGETDRKDFGSLISGTQEQKIEAMERLRFKPFEVEEFEEQNRNFFEKANHQHMQNREISQAAKPAAVSYEKNYLKESIKNEASSGVNKSSEFKIILGEDLCRIRYDGQEEVFKNKVGFHHIAFLIVNTPNDMACQTVYHENNAAPPDNDSSINYSESFGEDLTQKGTISYQPGLSKSERDRLTQSANKVLKNLDSFKNRPDSLEKEKAKKEWHSMKNYCLDHGLKTIIRKNGLTFKELKKGSGDDEKARTNVKNNIKNAIEEIGKKLPQLAEHFDKTIKTGYKCAYLQPQDEEIAWEIIRLYPK